MRAALPAFLILLLAQPAVGAAAALPESEAREVVANFMRSVQSFQADFSQTLSSASGELLEEEAGHMWLQRPGQFRWHYSDPWDREIVADQQTIWLYDAELAQVTVRPVEDALLQSPAALLVGDIAVLQDYRISGERSAANVVAVTLEPLTARGDFQAIVLGFSKGELSELTLMDRFGQRTSIVFSAVERNPQLDVDIFNFVMPDGVDVIDQRPE